MAWHQNAQDPKQHLAAATAAGRIRTSRRLYVVDALMLKTLAAAEVRASRVGEEIRVNGSVRCPVGTNNEIQRIPGKTAREYRERRLMSRPPVADWTTDFCLPRFRNETNVILRTLGLRLRTFHQPDQTLSGFAPLPNLPSV
jgi:hypothetical protein